MIKMNEDEFHRKMREILLEYGYEEFVLAALNKVDERIIIAAEGRDFNLFGLTKELYSYLQETSK